MQSPIRLLIPAALAVICPSVAAQAQPPLLIALGGNTTIGNPNGYPGNSFGPGNPMQYPAIADNGDVIFGSRLTQFIGGSFQPTLWVNRNGENDSLFPQNAPVAEIPGSTYSTLHGLPPPVLGPDSQILYVADIQNQIPTSTTALVVDSGTGPHLIATLMTPAPGVPGSDAHPSAYRSFDSFQSSGSSVAFSSTVSSALGVVSGIWRFREGELSNVVYAGQSGGIPGASLESPSLVGIASNGDVTFNSLVEPVPGVPPYVLDSVWVSHASGGPASLIVQGNQPAPGTESGTVFGRASPSSTQVTRAVAQSSSGGLVIYGELSGPQVTITNDTGLWRNINGVTSLIAREGDPAPGAAAGVTLGPLSAVASINARGHSSFLAPLIDPSAPDTAEQGLFTDVHGAPFLAAHVGEAAPGLPAGTTFESFRYSALMDNDDLVFFAQVQSGAYGAWYVAPDGETVPIAVPGQQLDFSGNLFTIGTVDSSLTNSQGNQFVNANGQLVLRVIGAASLQSAIVVFTIPAPTSAIALAMVGLAGFRRTRR